MVDKNNQFVIKDNTINTNSLGIKFLAGWHERVNCEDLKLFRTKIIKFPENSSKFQTYQVTGYQGQVKDVYLVDTMYENGATEDNIYFYQDLSFGELTQVSTTKFLVKDAQGISVPGATVKLTNRLGKQVFSEKTNGNGEYISEVPYKKHSKSGGKTDFNPIALTASYDCKVGSKQINVSNLTKEFSVNLPSKKTFPCP
jgi:hypothetical protein